MPEPSISRGEVIKLLSQALGHEKATDVVAQAAFRLGIRREILDKSQALSVPEQIAQTPGLVGITARFAKSRLHLR